MRVRRNLAEAAFELPINEIADQCRSIYPDELLNAAVVKMNHSRFRQLAVVERGDEDVLEFPRSRSHLVGFEIITVACQ
jgi:CBS domain-containing protein